MSRGLVVPRRGWQHGRARNLDDEWGINHSYLLFELFGSTADFGGSSLAWTGGLGLTF